MNTENSSPGFTTPASRAMRLIESVDHTARELELKWGPGRLRLLVDEDLRGKFDRQRVKFNAAVWELDDRQTEKHAGAMQRAWQALDEAAVEAGAAPLDPDVFEAAMDDGTVVAICRSDAEAFVAADRFKADGRSVNVWSVHEVARMVAAWPEVVEVKRHFPGAAVEGVKTQLPDELNDEVPF